MKSSLTIVLLLAFVMTYNNDATAQVHPGLQILPFKNDNLIMAVASSNLPHDDNYYEVTDMHFFNKDTGLILTSNGKIYMTADMGDTWSLKFSSHAHINQILFTDKNTGYAVGIITSKGDEDLPGGFVMKTNDGGNSWSKIYQVRGSFTFNSIAINSEGNLFMLDDGNILKSTDGGISWDEIYKDYFNVVKIVFNGNYGFCIGGDGVKKGVIVLSTDNGTTWNVADTLSDWVIDIAFSGTTGYCVIGGDGTTLYKTTDNGKSWTQVFHSSKFVLNKISALSYTSCLLWGREKYSGGNNTSWYGAVRQTTNGSATWLDNLFEGLNEIKCVSFYTSADGYIIGGHGRSNLIKVTLK